MDSLGDSSTSVTLSDSGITRDSSTNLKGYLRKKSRVSRWQRRWFEANDHFLTYYKNEKSDKLLACIDLLQTSQIEVVSPGDPQHAGEFSISIGDRFYVIKADNEEEAQNWVKELCARRDEKRREVEEKGDEVKDEDLKDTPSEKSEERRSRLRIFRHRRSSDTKSKDSTDEEGKTSPETTPTKKGKPVSPQAKDLKEDKKKQKKEKRNSKKGKEGKDETPETEPAAGTAATPEVDKAESDLSKSLEDSSRRIEREFEIIPNVTKEPEQPAAEKSEESATQRTISEEAKASSTVEESKEQNEQLEQKDEGKLVEETTKPAASAPPVSKPKDVGSVQKVPAVAATASAQKNALLPPVEKAKSGGCKDCCTIS